MAPTDMLFHPPPYRLIALKNNLRITNFMLCNERENFFVVTASSCRLLLPKLYVDERKPKPKQRALQLFQGHTTGVSTPCADEGTKGKVKFAS